MLQQLSTEGKVIKWGAWPVGEGMVSGHGDRKGSPLPYTRGMNGNTCMGGRAWEVCVQGERPRWKARPAGRWGGEGERGRRGRHGQLGRTWPVGEGMATARDRHYHTREV
jgi:hypothetical protein